MYHVKIPLKEKENNSEKIKIGLYKLKIIEELEHKTEDNRKENRWISPQGPAPALQEYWKQWGKTEGRLPPVIPGNHSALRAGPGHNHSLGQRPSACPVRDPEPKIPAKPHLELRNSEVSVYCLKLLNLGAIG